MDFVRVPINFVTKTQHCCITETCFWNECFIWCGFDRASSLCGNKIPTRCNRWFLLHILLLAQHVLGHHYAHHQELKLDRDQLKMAVATLTGHAPVRGRLRIMGLFSGDPSCRFCKLDTETVQHITCCCEALARQRYNIFGKPFVEPKDISTASLREGYWICAEWQFRVAQYASRLRCFRSLSWQALSRRRRRRSSLSKP